jgi:Tfp pilus assembly protein PilF
MSCLHRLLVAAATAVVVVPALCGCGSPEMRHASHMKRGERYLAEGRFDKAQIEFRSALQIAPGDVAARVMIGHIAEREGNIREAFGDYRAAVDLAPESAVARASLARIYVFAD